jgi:hypothetical protein
MANTLLDQMLASAAKAAGSNWAMISDDLKSFAENLINDSKRIAADLASGKISQDEAKVQLQMLADYADIVANYGEDAVKASVQVAFNAAVDTLWLAISAV